MCAAGYGLPAPSRPTPACEAAGGATLFNLPPAATCLKCPVVPCRMPHPPLPPPVQRSVFDQQAQSRAQSKAGRLGLQNQQVGWHRGMSRLLAQLGQATYCWRRVQHWWRVKKDHACVCPARCGSAPAGVPAHVSAVDAAPQVCQISGLIINNEESRLQDHYSGRNYKCAAVPAAACSVAAWQRAA